MKEHGLIYGIDEKPPVLGVFGGSNALVCCGCIIYRASAPKVESRARPAMLAACACAGSINACRS